MFKVYNSTKCINLNYHRLKRITSNLEYVFYCYFVIKSLINLILQCSYAFLEQRYRQTAEPAFKEIILTRMVDVLDVMIQVGQYFRGSHTVGILYYSILVSAGFVYSVMKKVFNNRVFNYIEEEGFVLSIMHPSLEYYNIERLLTSYINQLRESNINFTRKIHFRMKNRIDFNYLQNIHEDDHNEDYSIRHRILEQIGSDYSMQWSTMNNNPNSNIVFFHDLNEQLEHLSRLNSDKTNIWPVNRTKEFVNEVKQYWIVSYKMIFILGYPMAHIWAGYMIYSSYKSLLESSLSEKYRNFTFSDRLNAAELHIWFFYARELYLHPVLLTLACIKDQTKFLSSLILKARKICSQIRQIESMERDELSQTTFDKMSQVRRDLDEKMVELYIDHLLFCDHAKLSAKLVANVIGEIMSFMLLVTLPVIIYYREIPNDQMPLFVIMTVGMFISLNFVLFFCAHFQSSCGQISRVAWVIVALIEHYNLRKCIRSIRRRSNNPTKGIDYYKDDQGFSKQSPNIDLEYYSGCLVTPHTVSLWRNLAKHSHIINDGFACRLLNIFKIDYVGIIKLNHWFVSLILFIATYYHH